MKICTSCKERPVLAKGLCGRCYQRKVAHLRPYHACECGCDNLTQGPRFIAGHNTRLLSSKEQGRRGRFCNGVERPNSGFWYRKVNYKHQHRQVMEEFLGRPLRSNEVIHHKNGLVRDNRLSNLRLMTRSEHAKLHFKRWRKMKEKTLSGSGNKA